MTTRLVSHDGRRALEVDGVIQSIEVVPGEPTPGYWGEMVPPGPIARALILGHAGGTIARILLEAHRFISILAVDASSDVLAMAASDERLACRDERLQVELGDAFEVMRRLDETGARFDFIAIDLYRGGEIERGSLARPFLRRIERALVPGGLAAFNLARDRRTTRRLRRLGQHLRIVRTTLIGLNCIVHCGPARIRPEP